MNILKSKCNCQHPKVKRQKVLTDKITGTLFQKEKQIKKGRKVWHSTPLWNKKEHWGISHTDFSNSFSFLN